MANDLDRTFRRLRKEKKKALIAYLTAGYPRFSEQEKLIAVLENAGVDVLELGVPFSDPIADGPTIQFSSQEALKRGVSLSGVLKWARRIRPRIRLPFVLMTYLNPIVAYGVSRFARDARRAGVAGVIVPDLIVEEGRELEAVFKSYGLHLIYLIAPTTPAARQSTIAGRSGGFLYAVSVAGVTGARKAYSPQTVRWLRGLRLHSSRPVCVGFGISGPRQIRQLRSAVDGFIVGSALIDIIRKNRPGRRIREMGRFVSSLLKECAYGR